MTTIDYSTITNWEKLSGRRQAFCLEYLADGVGSAAAIRAGYAGKNAAKTASLLLAEPLIRGVIDQLRKAVWSEEELSIEEAKVLLARKARADIGKVLDEHGAIDPVLVKKHSAMLRGFSEEDTKFGRNRKVELPDPIAAINLHAKLSGWLDKKPDSHLVGDVKITVNLGEES